MAFIQDSKPTERQKNILDAIGNGKTDLYKIADVTGLSLKEIWEDMRILRSRGVIKLNNYQSGFNRQLTVVTKLRDII